MIKHYNEHCSKPFDIAVDKQVLKCLNENLLLCRHILSIKVSREGDLQISHSMLCSLKLCYRGSYIQRSLRGKKIRVKVGVWLLHQLL